ncbi:MAG TPA: AAA family ATPase [Longimicrobiaceae bacterium]|nr:AAA family ATPase [Longimicrobiaceae bacterium]
MNTNNVRIIAGALISADAAFREWLAAALPAAGSGVNIMVEIRSPFAGIDADQLGALRQASPSLVFLDLDDDPDLGVRLAEFLTENHPGWKIVAFGRSLSPELLMAVMQAGISEYVPKPVTDEAFRAALARVERKLGSSGEGDGGARAPGELIACFSPKGGVGTTTVATNVAVQLHRLTGKKTLLVDLDLEMGEAALLLGVQPRFNVVDIAKNLHRMDADLLGSYTERHESGVHLLAAPYEPDRADAVSGDQARSILAFLKQHYDYVVVDTAHTFSPLTVAAFEEATSIYVVTTVDLPSLRNIKRSLPLIERITGDGKERIRLVVNRYHPNNAISVQEAERTLGLVAHWRLANDFEAVMGSINTGKPVVLGAASPFSHDLQGLAADAAGIAPAAGNGAGRLGGILKLFGRRQETRSHG